MDRSEPVASAVLVSAMHLLPENIDLVKRWTTGLQEVVVSRNGMVQFHALTLLHALRANDRLAVSKLVSSMTNPARSKLSHPMAQLMLVRYVAQVKQEKSLCGVLSASAFQTLHHRTSYSTTIEIY